MLRSILRMLTASEAEGGGVLACLGPLQRAFEEMSKKVEASASPPKAGGVAKYSMVDFNTTVKFHASNCHYHLDVRDVPKLTQIDQVRSAAKALQLPVESSLQPESLIA